ncbi:unnamed protein product, partial [marine sediment metagenome]
DRGKGAEEENERIFDQLGYSQKEIEKDYGDSLNFERLKGRRACRIAERLDLGGYRDEERWPEIQEAMIDAMIRLEKALKPHIRRLKHKSMKPGES